ncbi:MAG: hypothetical protein ISR65_19475 [Bacteriovoracaceae bacterium]|nr:hypothetical protein [Bacteriovoracaceae bacterium]
MIKTSEKKQTKRPIYAEEEMDDVPTSNEGDESNHDLELLKELIDSESSTPKIYSTQKKFRTFDLIDHPNFGVGFVKSSIQQDKIRVFFQDKERILLHNKK